MTQLPRVLDKKGVEIKPGQMVLVSFIEQDPRLYVVLEVDGTRETLNEPGHWIEVEEVMPTHGGPTGQEGMMSYICEVIADRVSHNLDTHDVDRKDHWVP